MRRILTRRFVVVISILLFLAGIGWAALVDGLVDGLVADACDFPTPPPKAQYPHCP